MGNNLPRYCNEEYDELMADLAVTANLEDRAELVKELNDMLVQDTIIIPLIHRGSLSAHANTLSGVLLNSWDTQMWNVADWTRVGQ
jgi:peptide/nickel transport system substrate-binding protein